MADLRHCDQCDAMFAPRREHGRFCSGQCRVAWNLDRPGDPVAGLSALQWSITAMNDTAQRLPAMTTCDQPRAFAVIGEMVWQVTIVDATLMRYHPDGYDGVIASQAPAERRRIEGTLTGLRFVRNRMRHEAGRGGFIGLPPGSSGAVGVPIMAWAWKPLPEPVLSPLLPRGRAWEQTRYQAYQAYLAGRAVGEIFGRATAFLNLTASHAPMVSDISAPAAR
jgi:hypothetical protein